MFALKNKKALVTGASGGIGGAISRVLHAQGVEVALAGRNRQALERLKSELGNNSEVIVGDFSQADTVESMLEKASSNGRKNMIKGFGINKISQIYKQVYGDVIK